MAEIIFGTYVAEEKENPYTETVTQLIEANDENASVTIVIDAAEAAKHHRYFNKAANAQNKTARMRVRDDSKVKYTTDENGEPVIKGGTVSLTFTLTKRHQGRRSKTATV